MVVPGDREASDVARNRQEEVMDAIAGGGGTPAASARARLRQSASPNPVCAQIKLIKNI